jgi:hypothetical protein
MRPPVRSRSNEADRRGGRIEVMSAPLRSKSSKAPRGSVCKYQGTEANSRDEPAWQKSNMRRKCTVWCVWFNLRGTQSNRKGAALPQIARQRQTLEGCHV